MPLPFHFTLRPYQIADAPSVVDLVNAEGRQTLGLQCAVLDALGQVRLMRYVPADNEKVVAIDTDGQVNG